MYRAVMILGSVLLLAATAPAAQANPLMATGGLAAAAPNDDLISEVRWRRCHRWHCRHYGWRHGRHYGWRHHRHHHRYWR